MVDQVAEETLASPPPGGWGARRGVIVVAALVGLASVAAGVWWLTHPTWFSDFGAEEGVVSTPGRPVWVGVTFPDVSAPPITVHLDSVAPHVVSDTSGATVTSFVCTNRPFTGPGITVLGSGGTAMMRDSCAHLARARDVDMTVGRGHPEYLLLKMVPAHLGHLRIDRVGLTYGKGLQHGTQWIRFALTMQAHPPLGR